MKRPMFAFLTQLLLAIRSCFGRRARLEAENLILRQQLVVLRRKSPKRVSLWVSLLKTPKTLKSLEFWDSPP
jgi:IS1 family transposase